MDEAKDTQGKALDLGGKSLLLIGFGQSNADVHNAGPAIEAPALEDVRITMPADGYGFRGYMGRPRAGVIEGFAPVHGFETRVQSMLACAAARVLQQMGAAAPAQVIIRSEAKGGRRFLGLEQNGRDIGGILRDADGHPSLIWNNLITTVQQIAAAARAGGQPLGAVGLVFAHGESDRGMARAEYRALAEAMLDAAAAQLAPLGVPLHWFAVQPGGPGGRGSGNAWANRLAIAELAQARPEVTLAAAGYGYPISDEMHFSAQGKALLGERIGQTVEGWLTGRNLSLPRLAEVEAEGLVVRLRFATPAPLMLDAAPGCGHHGFAVLGTGARVASVRVAGPDLVEVQLTGPPRPKDQLAYAYRAKGRHTPMEGPAHWPFGGGALRTVRSAPSLILPGQEVVEWVPGFLLPPFGELG